MRKVCVKDGKTFYQCPGSQQQYGVLKQYSSFQELSRVCPEDTYHYTACYLPSFTPLLFNNTVVAVCGHYVCEYSSGSVYSGEKDTSYTWCDNSEDCYNGGVDEMYCAEEEKGVFPCYGDSTSTSKVCDGKCDCPNYCKDEWECGGYNYFYTCSNTSYTIPFFYACANYKYCRHGDDESNCEEGTCVWERYSDSTYKLANYSRCLPWVMCDNKLDHTNCTDTRLAPLQCYVGGYMSTVSQYIICKSTVYTFENSIHSNTSAVCDDGMDTQCVTPIPGCEIHKHQLCNNIPDCKGGSDEKSSLCSRVTTQDCQRKYHFSTELKIPVDWIKDGIVDCVNGIDEDITKWKHCEYSTFTIYGIENCEDVYICPSGSPLYVDIKSICDVMLSCQGGIEICNSEVSTSSQLIICSSKCGKYKLFTLLLDRT